SLATMDRSTAASGFRDRDHACGRRSSRPGTIARYTQATPQERPNPAACTLRLGTRHKATTLPDSSPQDDIGRSCATRELARHQCTGLLFDHTLNYCNTSTFYFTRPSYGAKYTGLGRATCPGKQSWLRRFLRPVICSSSMTMK